MNKVKLWGEIEENRIVLRMTSKWKL